MLNDSLLFTGVPAQRRRGIFTGPVLDVDRNNGRVYIVYTDTTATKNLPDTDIFLVSSNNQGTNWSPSPVAVEQSTGTDFLPWIDVDQTTGSVNVIYYTTDGDVSTGNDDVNVRVRTSTDGGASFPVAQSVNLSTATSNAGASNYVGDFLEYIGLAVLDGTIHGLWSDNRGMASDLEAFTASAATTSAGNVLRVTGDDNDETDDLISISLSTVNSDFLEVFVNGERQFTGLSASISSIEAFGLAGEDILKSPASDDLLDGGDGDDKLFAGDGNDTLLGGDGDDTLLGEAGNDKLEGNDDDDKLFGGDGNDKLDGGEDDDKLFAGDGDDTLIGGDGDDTLLGEAGNDKLDGGKDDDKLSAGDGNDTLIGGEGDDTLVGEAGNDKLDGGKDDDKLSAGDGNDTLIGGEGDDTLVGEAGNDKLDGGEDDDKLSGGDGNDTLIGGNDDDTLLGGSSQDRLFGDAGNDKLKGNDGDDKLFGGDGDDKLFGGQGQDQLFGDAGDDLLYGGTGDNTMTGGAGNDTFVLSTEGKNNIIDFQDGQDLLGLTGGLTFDSLSIFGQNNGTFINTSNNQPLTFLANVNPNLLTADDFITV
ncbi:MAG: calcium-binding protein [Calothrix sp. MO_192.B10]|nr:calcium-binding protein [Calothrix sp. MO_192.B10]